MTWRRRRSTRRAVRAAALPLLVLTALLTLAVNIVGARSAPAAMGVHLADSPQSFATPDAAVLAVTVQAGDTLWDIARRHTPIGSDVRRMVHAIRRANSLPTSTIHPGQTLLIPH